MRNSARANAWFHALEFDKAIADFGEAIRIGPLDTRDYYYRGLRMAQQEPIGQSN